MTLRNRDCFKDHSRNESVELFLRLPMDRTFDEMKKQKKKKNRKRMNLYPSVGYRGSVLAAVKNSRALEILETRPGHNARLQRGKSYPTPSDSLCAII